MANGDNKQPPLLTNQTGNTRLLPRFKEGLPSILLPLKLYQWPAKSFNELIRSHCKHLKTFGLVKCDRK